MGVGVAVVETKMVENDVPTQSKILVECPFSSSLE